MQRRYIALLLTQTMPDVDRLPLIFYSKARVLAVTLAVVFRCAGRHQKPNPTSKP